MICVHDYKNPSQKQTKKKMRKKITQNSTSRKDPYTILGTARSQTPRSDCKHICMGAGATCCCVKCFLFLLTICCGHLFMSINSERQLRVEWLHAIQWHRQIGLVNEKETGPQQLGRWVSVGQGLSHSSLTARAGVSNLSCEKLNPGWAPIALDSRHSLK